MSAREKLMMPPCERHAWCDGPADHHGQCSRHLSHIAGDNGSLISVWLEPDPHRQGQPRPVISGTSLTWDAFAQLLRVTVRAHTSYVTYSGSDLPPFPAD
jgi:hypothetical protein